MKEVLTEEESIIRIALRIAKRKTEIAVVLAAVGSLSICGFGIGHSYANGVVDGAGAVLLFIGTLFAMWDAFKGGQDD